MDSRLASYAIELLQTANLTGAEVPVYNAVMQALHEIAHPPQLEIPVPVREQKEVAPKKRAPKERTPKAPDVPAEG